MLDIKIKSSAQEKNTLHKWINVFLETLNRGIVKDVGALDYEASIFFCDYGSVANIRVSLHKSKEGGGI